MILVKLFTDMVWANLAAVGGGYGSVAVAQALWVGPGGISPTNFAMSVGLGQVTPGPFITFCVAMGWLIAGPMGALSAFTGVCLASWVVSSAADMGLGPLRSFLPPYIRAIGWIVPALALSSGIKIVLPLGLHSYELILLAGATGVMSWGRVDPVWVIGATTVIGGLIGFLA